MSYNWNNIIPNAKRRISMEHQYILYEDIEDAVQEAACRFFEEADKSKFPDSETVLISFIEKVAYYLLLDNNKKNNRILRFDYPDTFTGFVIYEIIEFQHFEEIEHKIDWKLLYEQCLTYLTERQRKILNYELEGYTNSEIAQMMGISDMTVKREKKKYREIIKEKLPPPLKYF